MEDKPNSTASDGRSEYEAYLRSGAWQRKSQLARERDNHRCRLCNSSNNLQVHHRTYGNTRKDGLGKEPLEDLTTLCRRCHEKFHAGKPKRSAPLGPGKSKKARKKQRKREARKRELREKKRREGIAKTRDRSPKAATKADIEALAQQMNAHLRLDRREGKSTHAGAPS